MKGMTPNHYDTAEIEGAPQSSHFDNMNVTDSLHASRAETGTELKIDHNDPSLLCPYGRLINALFGTSFLIGIGSYKTYIPQG